MVVHTVWCSTLELYHGCTYSMVQYTGVIPWLYIQYGAVHWSYTMAVHTVWCSTLELYHGCTYSMVQYTGVIPWLYIQYGAVHTVKSNIKVP